MNLSKLPKQLEAMQKDRKVCCYCGQDALITDLDCDTEHSLAMQSQAGGIAEIFGEYLRKREV